MNCFNITQSCGNFLNFTGDLASEINAIVKIKKIMMNYNDYYFINDKITCEVFVFNPMVRYKYPIKIKNCDKKRPFLCGKLF
jgi:hypothetical protein